MPMTPSGYVAPSRELALRDAWREQVRQARPAEAPVRVTRIQPPRLQCAWPEIEDRRDAARVAERHRTMLAALDAPVPSNLLGVAMTGIRIPVKCSDAA